MTQAQYAVRSYVSVCVRAYVCVCVMVSGVKQILLKTPHPAAKTQPLLSESHEAALKLSLITTNLEFVLHDLLKYD